MPSPGADPGGRQQSPAAQRGVNMTNPFASSSSGGEGPGLYFLSLKKIPSSVQDLLCFMWWLKFRLFISSRRLTWLVLGDALPFGLEWFTALWYSQLHQTWHMFERMNYLKNMRQDYICICINGSKYTILLLYTLLKSTFERARVQI